MSAPLPLKCLRNLCIYCCSDWSKSREECSLSYYFHFSDTIALMPEGNKELNHRIIEWFDLEGTFEIIQFQPPSCRQGHFFLDQVALSPSECSLECFQDGAFPVSLGSLFQCLNRFTVKHFFPNIQPKSTFFQFKTILIVLFLPALTKCSAMMNFFSELLMSGKGYSVMTCPPQGALCNLFIFLCQRM